MGIIIYCITSLLLLSKVCQSVPIDTPGLRCDQPADIIFVVDTSSSIWPEDFNNHVKTFLKEIISSFNIGQGPLDSRVGVLLFGNAEYLQFYLNKHKTVNDTLKAIDAIRYRGGDTYTHRALEYTAKWMLNPIYGARPDVAKIVIVLTDGKSVNTKKTLAAAQVIKDKGVDIFAVGVGRGVDYKELNGMATAPNQHYVFQVTDFGGLSSIKKSFTKTTCEALSTTAKTTISTTTPTTTTTTTSTTPTTTTTTPSTTTTTTTTTTTPTTTSTPTTTTTTPTTTTTSTPSTTSTTTSTTLTTSTSTSTTTDYPKDEACQGKAADIYFLLDSSSSVWIVHFNDQVLPFVRDLVSSFHISPLHTRIGLVTFSDKINPEFNLSAFSDRKSLLASIQPEHVEYLSGQTNTGEAIKYVTDIGFGPSEVREGVTKIIITVTDGQSQIPEFTANAAAEAKKKGVIMFAVGVGKLVDEMELTAISSDPDKDFVFHVDNFNALSSITELIASRTCDSIGKEYPHDSKQCSEAPSNIVFVYEYFPSVSMSKIILDDLVSKFSQEVSYVSTEVKIGTLTQPCIGEGVSLLGIKKFRQALAAVREGYDTGYSGLMSRLRGEVFLKVSRETRNVAVLVITPAISDWESVALQAKQLKDMGVTIFLVVIGDIKQKMLENLASAPVEDHVIKVKHYNQLKYATLDVSNIVCGIPEIQKPIIAGSKDSPKGSVTSLKVEISSENNKIDVTTVKVNTDNKVVINLSNDLSTSSLDHDYAYVEPN
ncbi:collagen alpha-4(VI) chain [Biomphalaria glabrata]|nr:collagen alpha-4(VI) chain-like [Biomphalaria glabrata]